MGYFTDHIYIVFIRTKRVGVKPRLPLTGRTRQSDRLLVAGSGVYPPVGKLTFYSKEYRAFMLHFFAWRLCAELTPKVKLQGTSEAVDTITFSGVRSVHTWYMNVKQLDSNMKPLP